VGAVELVLGFLDDKTFHRTHPPSEIFVGYKITQISKSFSNLDAFVEKFYDCNLTESGKTDRFGSTPFRREGLNGLKILSQIIFSKA
jgi:hypothetical protein